MELTGAEIVMIGTALALVGMLLIGQYGVGRSRTKHRLSLLPHTKHRKVQL